MSFINEIKNEVSRITIESSYLVRAEIAAYIRTCSKLRISQNNISLEFSTDNASTARRLFTLLKSYSDNIEAFTKRSNRLNKKNIYIIAINDKMAIQKLFQDTEFSINNNIFDRSYEVSDNILQNDNCLRAFIRALFLTSGTVSNPEKSYHLEMNFYNDELADFVKIKLNKSRMAFKLIERNDTFVVYIKEGELISDFLVFIGANQSVLKFENIRAMKEIRNNVNRVINFETANINKTVKASMRHINDINYLIQNGSFDSLPGDLQEVALLRLENEEASLSEVAKLSNKYSRSSINYRLKKISNFADKLRGVDNEGNEG